MYVPLVIAEAIPIAQSIGTNQFIDYQYVEVQAVREEETPITTVKIIKIN